MTTLTRPTEAGPAFSPTSIGAPPAPQINLLPPGIRARRQTGRLKLRLAIALLGVLVLVALGTLYAMRTESQAADRLQDKRDAVADLVAQQARYAEVPQIKGAIEDTVDARTEVMATEVLWEDYLRAIQATTPLEVKLVDLTTTMPSVVQAPSPSMNPLDQPSLGNIVFNAEATTLPDMAAWMDALDTVPGFGDATFDTATLSSKETSTGYMITVRIQLDAGVLALRYTNEEAGS